MRRLKGISIALAGSALLCAGTANAQLGTGIVFDPRAFAQQIKQLEQARQAIVQGKQQIEQAQSLYRDLNKATDISNVAADNAAPQSPAIVATEEKMSLF